MSYGICLSLTSLSMTMSSSIHVAVGKGKFSQKENYQILFLQSRGDKEVNPRILVPKLLRP